MCELNSLSDLQACRYYTYDFCKILLRSWQLFPLSYIRCSNTKDQHCRLSAHSESQDSFSLHIQAHYPVVFFLLHVTFTHFWQSFLYLTCFPRNTVLEYLNQNKNELYQQRGIHTAESCQVFFTECSEDNSSLNWHISIITTTSCQYQLVQVLHV